MYGQDEKNNFLARTVAFSVILFVVVFSLCCVSFAGYDEWTAQQKADMKAAALATGESKIKDIRNALNQKPVTVTPTPQVVAVEKPVLIQKAEQGYLKQYDRLFGDTSYTNAVFENVVGYVITLDADDLLPNKFSPAIMYSAFEKMEEWWSSVKPNTQAGFHPYPWGEASLTVTHTIEVKTYGDSTAETIVGEDVGNLDVEQILAY